MAKNTISTPIKDGVKADNSTYSSNMIEKIVKNAADAIIDDSSEGSDNSTFSSAKIIELISQVPGLEGVLFMQKSDYDAIVTPTENTLYIVLDKINTSGDGGGDGVYRYYYYFNGVCLNPDNAERKAQFPDCYYENLFFNGGGSVYKSANNFSFFSADNTNRNWTVIFKARSWVTTTKNMIGMSRSNAPLWTIPNNGNTSSTTLTVKGDTTESTQYINLGNIEGKEVKVVRTSGEISAYVDDELKGTVPCVMSSTANSDWFRIGGGSANGSTFIGVFEYVGCRWDDPTDT